MSEQITAPWSEEQVEALNLSQNEGVMHPYTCPNRGDGKHIDRGIDVGALLATPEGWMCEDCDYKQTWAHAFSAGGAPGIQ